MEGLGTWALAGLSITGVILNIKRKRVCFLVWIAANLGWVVVNLAHGIYAEAFLFLVYTGLAVWGFIEWGRAEKIRQPAKPPGGEQT